MKRSARIKLLLMGSAVFALTACDEDETQASIYSSVDECIAAKVYTAEYCQKSWSEAVAQNIKVAPKYTSKEDCEADFGPGRCEQPPADQATQAVNPAGGQTASSGGGSFWMPLMAGFMVGQLLGNNQPYYGQPLYRPYERSSYGGGSYSWGTWRTAGNVDVGNRSGNVTVTRTTVQPPAPRTTTISRGGFGARASSVGVSSSS